MTTKFRIFSFFASSLTFCSMAFAAPQTDFDVDGTSDLLFQSTSGSNYLWESVPSGAGAALSETFGLVTDIIAPAPWISAGTSSLGVVRASQTTGQLTWRALLSNSLIESRNFGKAGGTVISGADFDGDGVADAAVVTLINGRLKWRVRLGIFTESSVTWTFFLGKNGDRVTFARIEEGKDSPVAFGIANNLRYGRILTRTFGVSRIRNLKRFPKALTKNTRPRPIPIEGESGLDNLAFFVEDESDTNIKLFSVDGTQISNITVPGKGSFAIGDYESDIPGEEIAFQANSKVRVLNPETEDVELRDDVSGTVACEVNISNTVAVTPTPTPTPEE